ncbi:MAG: class I SAM-dependent methyltransferase [Geminicoccaceae bacterium]
MAVEVDEAFVQKAHEDVHAEALKGDGGNAFLRMCERYVDGHWRRFTKKVELFSKPLAGGVFVDFGSKFGHLTPLLIDQGVEKVYAVDVNDEYLEQGQRFFGARFPVTYVKSEDCYVDIPSASADFVLANEMISHINPGLLDTFYAEVARILKPSGELVISDGNNWAHLKTRLDLLDWYSLWESGTSKEFGERNYRLMRREMIAERYPDLSAEDLDYLAENTSGTYGERLFQQVERYVSGGVFIERPHRPGICPTHPHHGVVMERGFDPRQVIMSLEAYGVKAVQVLRGRVLEDDARRGLTKNFTIRGHKMPEAVEALAEHARNTVMQVVDAPKSAEKARKKSARRRKPLYARLFKRAKRIVRGERKRAV